MKKTKRIVSLLVVLVMMFAVVFTLTACNKDNENGDGGTYDITVWVSESAGVKEQFAEQIKRFNETNEYGYTFNATLEGVTEADAATNVINDVATAPDIYCFAQDQTARLVQAAALANPGKKATEELKASHDAGAIKAVTVGGTVRAYPLTSDNGYFMLYDKRVIKDDMLGDLSKLVKACEDAGRNFSMELSTSAWYTASFFFATGCKSEWTIDENGVSKAIDDTFNSDEGLIAMKGMQILTKSKSYVSSSNAAEFAAAIPSAIVVSGTWAVDSATKALNVNPGDDNLGFAELPSFTVDGKSYHLGSYSGNKLMGVKPQQDGNKAAGLSLLARYLTNEECQLERFNSFNWGPSNLKAQENENVKKNAALAALAKQNAYGTPQGQIDGGWWDVGKELAAASITAKTDDDLKAALKAYVASCDELLKITPEERRSWYLIGIVDWNTDAEMVEEPDNTWTSKVSYNITNATAFKIRQGHKWTMQVGVDKTSGELALCDGENITLKNFDGMAEGKHFIKVVFEVNKDGNVTGLKSIELIPDTTETPAA